jgi:heme-degrading monooxygenase HmoA
MVIVLVRTKLRDDADRVAYDALNEDMYRLVQSMPGFIGAAGYTSPDGEDVGVIRFASLEALAAWRDHPEHVAVQLRGRAEFYAAYTIEVCQVVRAYDEITSARRH